MNKNVTLSGYSKADVYDALHKAMKSQAYERDCYYSVELACTKNEIKALTSFLIDEYSQFRMSSDINSLEAIHNYMTLILGFSKKNIIYNLSFQKVLSEMVMLVALTTPTDRKLLRENVTYSDAMEPLLLKYQ